MFLFYNLIIFIIFWQLTVIWFIKLCVGFSTNIFLSTSLFMRIVVILTFNVYFNSFIFCDVNANAVLKLRIISTKFFFMMFKIFFSNYSFFDWFFAWFLPFCSSFVTRWHFYFSWQRVFSAFSSPALRVSTNSMSLHFQCFSPLINNFWSPSINWCSPAYRESAYRRSMCSPFFAKTTLNN